MSGITPRRSMGLPYMSTLGWCQRGQWGGIYSSPISRVWDMDPRSTTPTDRYRLFTHGWSSGPKHRAALRRPTGPSAKDWGRRASRSGGIWMEGHPVVRGVL